MLPWLIVNAIGIGLYSTILLVVGMILSGYFFFGYFLVGKHCKVRTKETASVNDFFLAFYGFLWYHVQCYYTTLAQIGDSNIIYAIVE